MIPSSTPTLVEGRLSYQVQAGCEPEIWSLWRNNSDRDRTKDGVANESDGNRSHLYESVYRSQPFQQMMWSQRFLHNILNAIADPIFVKDSQHRFVIVNNALCRFLGYSREELIGRRIMNYSPKRKRMYSGPKMNWFLPQAGKTKMRNH